MPDPSEHCPTASSACTSPSRGLGLRQGPSWQMSRRGGDSTPRSFGPDTKPAWVPQERASGGRVRGPEPVATEKGLPGPDCCHLEVLVQTWPGSRSARADAHGQEGRRWAWPPSSSTGTCVPRHGPQTGEEPVKLSGGGAGGPRRLIPGSHKSPWLRAAPRLKAQALRPGTLTGACTSPAEAKRCAEKPQRDEGL